MHAIELRAQAVQLADRLGYEVREEWLGGFGGACEVAGRKLMFVDSSLNVTEQLEQIADALMADPAIHMLELTPPLAQLLGIRRAA